MSHQVSLEELQSTPQRLLLASCTTKRLWLIYYEGVVFFAVDQWWNAPVFSSHSIVEAIWQYNELE